MNNLNDTINNNIKYQIRYEYASSVNQEVDTYLYNKSRDMNRVLFFIMLKGKINNPKHKLFFKCINLT